MNKDQVNGRATEVKGNVKEAAGKLVGNTKLETEGKIDQLKGTVQAEFGDKKAAVAKAINKLG